MRAPGRSQNQNFPPYNLAEKQETNIQNPTWT